MFGIYLLFLTGNKKFFVLLVFRTNMQISQDFVGLTAKNGNKLGDYSVYCVTVLVCVVLSEWVLYCNN